MTRDPPHVERRSSWREEHLDCICGLANGRGGVLNVHVRSDRGRDYLRIVVPSHLDQPENSQKTTRKQPETRGFRQNLANRILVFLRENPSAGRREITEALPDATEGSVRYQIDKLKAAGSLRRVGPDWGGRWEVIDDPDVEASEHAVGSAVEHRDRGTAQPAFSQKTTRKPPEDDQKTARNEGPATPPSLAERVGPDKGGHWKVLGEPATRPDR